MQKFLFGVVIGASTMFLFAPENSSFSKFILDDHKGPFGPAFILSETVDGPIALLHGFSDNAEACEALKTWIEKNGFAYAYSELE